MSLTTNPNDPGIGQTRPDGQQETYLVLSREERDKGYVRPLRNAYVHIGQRPRFPTRELNEVERERYGAEGYVLYEEYPESERPALGRLWTKAQLESGCGVVTRMASAIAETYARCPKFYGSTFCCGCGKHFVVEEFVWEGTTERVGS